MRPGRSAPPLAPATGGWRRSRRRTSPPRALHDERPAATVDERFDGLVLPVVEVGIGAADQLAEGGESGRAGAEGGFGGHPLTLPHPSDTATGAQAHRPRRATGRLAWRRDHPRPGRRPSSRRPGVASDRGRPLPARPPERGGARVRGRRVHRQRHDDRGAADAERHRPRLQRHDRVGARRGDPRGCRVAPREDQLRELLRGTFRSLERLDDTFRVRVRISGKTSRSSTPIPPRRTAERCWSWSRARSESRIRRAPALRIPSHRDRIT